MADNNVFFNRVVPIVGGLVATCMFLSPVLAVLNCRRKGALGALNPLPFTMIMANCVCWTAYAILIEDWFLIVPNTVGFLIGLFLFLTAYGIGVPDVRTRDRIHAVCMIDGAILCIITILERMVLSSQKSKEQLWGYTANVMLVFFFLSPLSTVFQVLRDRDSASLVLPLSIMNTVNGCLWCTYGLAIGDYFIWVPNAFGALLGIFQTILRVTFPQRVQHLRKNDSSIQLNDNTPSSIAAAAATSNIAVGADSHA